MSTSSTIAAAPFVVIQAAAGGEVHLLRRRRDKSVVLVWALEAPLDEGAAARALLPDLLLRGTASHPGMAEMAARCEELYGTELLGSAGAHGPLQVLRLGLVTLADRWVDGGGLVDEATALLAEAVHEPPLVSGGFRPDHVEQERANLVRAIEGLSDDKGYWAFRRLTEVMYAGSAWERHPWGRAEEAAALTEEAVRSAWRHVAQRAPSRLFIVGDVDESTALTAAERLARGEARPAPSRALPLPPAPTRPPLRVREAEPLAQSKLALGFRLPGELARSPAAAMFAAALGGDSHSRLFKRVREAEGLAYGCHARALGDGGRLVVQAGIDGAQAGRVEELVLEEVERLARDALPDGELELSRRAELRQLAQLGDEPRALIGFRLSALLSGRQHEVDEAAAAVAAVTPGDVAAVAAQARLDASYLLEGVPH